LTQNSISLKNIQQLNSCKTSSSLALGLQSAISNNPQNKIRICRLGVAWARK
jgi:hypothetical protein